jgi:hypothetical protein
MCKDSFHAHDDFCFSVCYSLCDRAPRATFRHQQLKFRMLTNTYEIALETVTDREMYGKVIFD